MTAAPPISMLRFLPLDHYTDLHDIWCKSKMAQIQVWTVNAMVFDLRRPEHMQYTFICFHTKIIFLHIIIENNCHTCKCHAHIKSHLLCKFQWLLANASIYQCNNDAPVKVLKEMNDVIISINTQNSSRCSPLTHIQVLLLLPPK